MTCAGCGRVDPCCWGSLPSVKARCVFCLTAELARLREALDARSEQDFAERVGRAVARQLLAEPHREDLSRAFEDR